jgi:Ion channel
MSDERPADLRDELAERELLSVRERLRAPDRYGVLLILILVMLILSAVLIGTRFERAVAVALMGSILLFALYTSRASRHLMRAALVVVPLLVLGTTVATASFQDARAVRVTVSVVMTLLLLSVLVAILRRLTTHLVISWNTILGAVCIYLLVGMVFASIYAVVGHAGDGPLFAQQESFDSADILYFSFTTLTTVGYGDLTMRADVARMLSVSEALIGQLYLVTTIGLVVGNLGRESRRRHAR